MLDLKGLYTIELKNKKEEIEITKCKIVNYNEDTNLYTISPYGIGTVIEGIEENQLTNISGSLSPKTIQSIVRNGNTDKYFGIYDKDTATYPITEDTDVNSIIWRRQKDKIIGLKVKKDNEFLYFDVLGIDVDEPTDNKLQHSLTVGLHDIFINLQFCPKQALFYFPDGLDVGTYNFTIKEHTWVSSDVNKTFYFTLTQQIPAKGQFVLQSRYNVTIGGSTAKTYSNPASSTEIETVTIYEGTNGTFLGNVNNAIDGNTNSLQRCLLGSNNYIHSPIRQYMNSSAIAGSVWTPDTNFDRPPSWVDTATGFLNGVDEDFLSVIGEVTKKTALSTVSDSGGSVETNERFFLPSRSEVYGGDEVTGGEGVAYPYYSNNSDLGSAGTGNDSNRIKYSDGSVWYWWLRSPYVDTANSVRFVFTTGRINNTSANGNYGVAPICCIV